ncbi:MAG: ABC transporter permease [Anaerolineae bacterium]|nr:ABC transporter permease [Anaerolineae bacterium]
MHLINNLRIALGALFANKMRSGLTMLGIIIGISAVITLVSVGQGVQTMVAEQMAGIGSDLIFVMPGELEESNASMKSNFLRSANISNLTLSDALALSLPTNAPGLLGVAPEFVGSGTVVQGSRNTQTTISGVTPNYQQVRRFEPILGRFITESDLQNEARVAVLGQTVVEDLFPVGTNPIGATIRVNRISFKVVGVMEKKGGSAFSDEDDVVFIPLTTAQTRLFGARTASGDYSVSVIYGQVADEAELEAARTQITRVLRREHGLLYSSDKDDFSVLTQADVASVLGSLTTVLTAFLGLIAAVSLIVGGIGIMNIMLVSVTERTREIGLRKAVGARRRDILGQFLIEAVVLSLVGGLIGILIGVSGTLAAGSMMTDLQTHISPTTILMATGFSIAVGLFFGIYPAARASRLNPIDALRYE